MSNKQNKKVSKKKKKRRRLIRRTLVLVVFVVLVVAFFKVVPVFVDLNGEKEVTIEVYSSYEDEGATNRFTGKELESVKNTVDTSTLGTYKVTYRVGLFGFSRTVKVVDTTAPVITLTDGDFLYLYVGDTYDESTGYTVSDNYDSLSTSDVTISGTVDTSTVGTYEIVYSCSDSSGNETSVTKTVEVVEASGDYSGTITNSAGVNSEIVEVITEFMNRYYQAIKYLRAADFSDLFSSDDQDFAYMANKAVEALIEYRKNYGSNLYLDDGYYDLTISSSSYTSSGALKVMVYEDDNVQFHYLDGLTSYQQGIYNSFYFVQEDGEYKLSYMYHEESFYIYFDNIYTTSLSDYTTAIDEIYDEYLSLMNAQLDERLSELEAVNSGEVTYSSSADVSYDRDAVSSYMEQYALARNTSSYNAWGSNCMNYVSQCLHAGGIPMDTTGGYTWYHYLNSYSVCWNAIGYFYNYITLNDIYDNDTSINYEFDLNLYLAEAGDVLFVNSEVESLYYAPHVIMVQEVVYDDNGDIVDLLVSGNTNDQYNWPLSAVGYPYVELLKINGYDY